MRRAGPLLARLASAGAQHNHPLDLQVLEAAACSDDHDKELQTWAT